MNLKPSKIFPYKAHHGFTLIELSIVLVIIGLIVGGVLVGKDLIEAAQIRKTMTQHEQFVTAINTFKLKYNAIPGDMANAINFFPSATNGNNNNMVDYGDSSASTPGETLQFWYQLSQAGLITESLTGQLDGSGNMVAGLNIPSSFMRNTAGWIFYRRDYNTSVNVYGRKGQTFELGSCSEYWSQPEPMCPGPVMTTLQAKALDTKMDDGLADKGTLYGTQAYNGGSPIAGCGGAWNAASGTYDLTITTLSCRLFFWYN